MLKGHVRCSLYNGHVVDCISHYSFLYYFSDRVPMNYLWQVTQVRISTVGTMPNGSVYFIACHVFLPSDLGC